MSNRYDTYGELLEKIDWEGGLDGFMNYCGGQVEEYLPVGDDELEDLANDLTIAWSRFESAGEEFLGLLEERRAGEPEADCE